MHIRSRALVGVVVCFGTSAAAATLEKESIGNGAGTLAETSAPAYEGAWGRYTANCANTTDFFVNTLIRGSRFLQYELSCTIERKERIGTDQGMPTWFLTVGYEAEGGRVELTARLTLETLDRLRIETTSGMRETYRQCTGPIPPEYRSVFED